MIAQIGVGADCPRGKTSLTSLRGGLRPFGSPVERDVYLWYASPGRTLLINWDRHSLSARQIELIVSVPV